jgi:UDP-N-acetylbacillosamine N-acetyltransferase
MSMSGANKLVILGFGGHARSVADVALSLGFNELLFLDANARDGENFMGFPVRKDASNLTLDGWQAFPAAGDSIRRSAQCNEIHAKGWSLATLISPSATCGVSAVISNGCFVGHHAHVGPMASVGVACILNTACVVEHECSVGDFSHISVNATMAGRSHVGTFSMLGAGATLIDGVQIGDHITIGAGATVCKSLREPGVYVGVPAKRLTK